MSRRRGRIEFNRAINSQWAAQGFCWLSCDWLSQCGVSGAFLIQGDGSVESAFFPKKCFMNFVEEIELNLNPPLSWSHLLYLSLNQRLKVNLQPRRPLDW